MSQEKAVVPREGTPPAATEPQPLVVTPRYVDQTKQSVALLQSLVRDVLVREIDYGRIPGTPQDSLWDPGASQIIAAFNCYPGQRRILKLEDSDQKIVACVEVPIISRLTQQEIGSGIGAASTLETKYKYRWVPNPQEWGYNETAIKVLKTKRGKDDEDNEITLYRIPNPEHSELLNTIIKMASKRAEVDAAESLPGVASVLRQIFSGKKVKTEKGKEYEGPRWQRFWGEVRRLGYTDQEAHAKLKVISMKDWLAQGHSLDDALDILRREEKEPQPEATIAGEGFHIDLNFLNEALKALKWDDETLKSYLVNKYKVSGEGTRNEVIARLKREQAEEFVKYLSEKLAERRTLL